MVYGQDGKTIYIIKFFQLKKCLLRKFSTKMNSEEILDEEGEIHDACKDE